MEDVEKEWEKLRPSVKNDYEKKKKEAKKAWKRKSNEKWDGSWSDFSMYWLETR